MGSKQGRRESRKARRFIRRCGCVLADKSAGFYHCEKYDADHSRKEDRFLTVASHPEDRSIVLVVSWTERNRGTALVTRIVSARHATCGERKIYAECVNGKIGL